MIYTKTGDAGTTSLADGTRVAKNDARVEAYGTVDELGAHLALLIQMIADVSPDNTAFLQRVQQELFVVQSRLATAKMETLAVMPRLDEEATLRIERQIDAITAAIPPMKAFVIPGGSMCSAQCHVARTVCRRAERCIVTLAAGCTAEQQSDLAPIQRYVNRLSDLLFVMSRQLLMLENKEEIFWHPQTN